MPRPERTPHILDGERHLRLFPGQDAVFLGQLTAHNSSSFSPLAIAQLLAPEGSFLRHVS